MPKSAKRCQKGRGILAHFGTYTDSKIESKMPSQELSDIIIIGKIKKIGI